MLGQHYKVEVDLLSYILSAKLKYCRQKTPKNRVLTVLLKSELLVVD